jgi:hypothetical protein
MNPIWFKRFGWVFLPISFMGMAVTILAATFLVPIFAAIIRNGHSVSDAFYQMFVYTTCTAFWWKWIAEKTS